MGFFKGLGIFVLSIIVIFLIFLSSFSFAASSLLYPDTYFNSLEKGGVYSYLEENLNSQTNGFVSIKGGPKNAINNIISNFLSYIRSDTDELNLSLTIIQNNSKEQTVNLEESLNLQKGSEGRKSLENLRDYVKIYKLSNILLIVLIAIFLFFIYLLKYPKTRGFLIISSICFMFSASILLLIVSFMTQIPNFVQSQEIISVKMIEAITNSIIEVLFKHVIILASISIAFFILSFIVKNKNIENNKSKINKNEKSNNSSRMGGQSKI